MSPPPEVPPPELATASVTAAVCDTPPLVPLIVSEELPTGVVLTVVTVSVDDPDVVIELGLNVAVAPEGSPLAVRATVPVKPPDGATLTV